MNLIEKLKMMTEKHRLSIIDNNLKRGKVACHIERHNGSYIVYYGNVRRTNELDEIGDIIYDCLTLPIDCEAKLYDLETLEEIE